MTTKKYASIKVSQEKITELETIETKVKEMDISRINSGFKKAFAVADAAQNLRKALNEEAMQPIMEMQGSSLGFRTDFDSIGGYAEDVVKESLIEAVMIGVQPAGNQFNIISGRCHITKEGFSYLLKNLPGFSDYEPQYELMEMQAGRAIVKCSATWTFYGERDSIECEIQIRLGNKRGIDVIIGKAARKLMARVYAQVSGTEITDGEAEAAQTTMPKVNRSTNYSRKMTLKSKQTTSSGEKRSTIYWREMACQ